MTELTWGSQADWDAATTEDIAIDGDVFRLANNIDSGDLHAHYDATELSLSDGESVTSWQDESGNGYDLTAGAAPTYVADGINGLPVVHYDGVDDYLDVAFSAVPEPNTIYVVVQWRASDTTNSWLFDSETDINTQHHYADHNEEWGLAGLSSGVTPDQNPHITGSFFAGTDTTLRLDGQQIVSGDGITTELNGMVTGRRTDDNFYANVYIGEILVYPQDKSGSQGGIENYLSDKWGITL